MKRRRWQCMLICWRSGRRERKGKEGTCTAKGKLMLENGSHCQGMEMLLLRTWKKGPQFPRAGALRGPLCFISIIRAINYQNHHLPQDLLLTMLGIHKELGWLLFWRIAKGSRRGVKHSWRCFVIISLIFRQTQT